jgi:TPR repeat protein
MIKPLSTAFILGIFAPCLSVHASTDVATRAATENAGKVSEASDTDACPAAKSVYPDVLSRDLDKSGIEQLTALADGGDAEAMVLLGLRYTPGDGTAEGTAGAQPTDLKRAKGLFEAAAAKQHGHGAFLLGVMYLSGSGVEKDEAKAAEWFMRGASYGSPLAQFWYGEMTAKGRGGLEENWAKALPYFKGALEGGVPDAFLEIGYMHFEGLGGLTKDDLRAAHCYRQAVKLGSPVAAYNLRYLIDAGHIAWEPGDPGEALEAKPLQAK